MKKLGVNHTLGACYIGYITQAIVVNFAPLLFVTFVADYNISLTLIGAMITVNFGVQLLVDLASSLFVDKIGYRPCLFAAHGFACVGLLLLAFLSRSFCPCRGRDCLIASRRLGRRRRTVGSARQSRDGGSAFRG